MCKEWWELRDDESRMLALYRRFDAVNHLPTELWTNGTTAVGRNEDLEEIIGEVATIVPETSLDFIAQSVMLAHADKIRLTFGQLASYMRRLDHYVESDPLPGDFADILMEDDILRTWARYWVPKATSVANKAGLGSPRVV